MCRDNYEYSVHLHTLQYTYDNNPDVQEFGAQLKKNKGMQCSPSSEVRGVVLLVEMLPWRFCIPSTLTLRC